MYVNRTGKIMGAAIVADLVLNGGRGTVKLGRNLLIGAVAAGGLSWFTNESVLLAVVHSLLGWYYLAYRLIAFLVAIN